MIQRIQTLWLVLAALGIALGFLTPVARYDFTMESTHQAVTSELNLIARDAPDMMDQMAAVSPTVEFGQRMAGLSLWPVVVLALLALAVTVGAIFLFKNRPLQVKVVAAGFVLCLAYIAVLLFWAVDAYSDRMLDMMRGSNLEVTWMVGAYAPIVSLIFYVAAVRAIRKDEALVKAADRLR